MKKKLNKTKKLTKVKEKSYRKMFIYIIIVNYGLGQTVIDMLQDNGSNIQASCIGKGTASKQVLNIIGLEDKRKDVILSVVDEKNIEIIKNQLVKIFESNDKTGGIAFSIKMTSIVGEKVYHFLTNTL